MDEIFSVLKNSFSGPDYTVLSFGILYGKSIIVGKSFNVGARVYLKKRVIEIHQSFGNPKAVLLGAGIVFLAMQNVEKKKKLQEQVFKILKTQFS